MPTYQGTSASERLDGSSGDDTIYGEGGHDDLYGHAGDDTIYGDAGDDNLFGGTGYNDLTGGTGDDWFIMDTRGAGFSDDLVRDFVFDEDRIDVSDWGASDFSQIQALLKTDSSGDAYLNAYFNGYDHFVTLEDVDADDLLAADFVFADPAARNASGTAYDDVMFGSRFNDTLRGGAGYDTLLGGLGADRLDGGLHADILWGGTGDDVYVVDNASDSVREYAGQGTDRVEASVSHTLYVDVENLTLTGSAAINGTGNSLGNTITGNGGANILKGMAGADILRGMAGNDRLDGGTGADRLDGGAGDDVLIVDNSGDVVVEAAGGGTDTVQSSVTHTLRANVEKLILTGSAAVNGAGNGLDNTVSGNGAANTLSGLDGDDVLSAGGGDDILNGGAGRDRMRGGDGADTFVFRAISDSATAAPDRIDDYDHAVDWIDLRTIDARPGTAGNQSFAWVDAFTGHQGEATLSYSAATDTTTLALDQNGDATADFRLLMAGHVTDTSGFLL